MLPLKLTTVAHFLGLQNASQALVTRVDFDSRSVQPGSLFFALEGKKQDGHHFICEAFSKGAVACVTQKGKPLPEKGLCLEVASPLLSLQYLARLVVEKIDPVIIAITGSNGKTTTKEFIRQILGIHRNILYTPKNYNTQITLPATLLNETKGDEAFFVLEMGLSEQGNLTRLVHIAPPTIAILTNVHYAHAVNFDSLEGILKAKSEIFSHPKTRHAIYPKHLSPVLPPHLNQVPYTPQQRPFPLPGTHNLANFEAAKQALLLAGLTEEAIEAHIPLLVLPEKRLEIVQKGRITFINDSYNANENSMKGALEVLSKLPNPRKVAVLGEMRELGAWSSSIHQRVATSSLEQADALFALGEGAYEMYKLWQTSDKPSFYFKDKKALLEKLKIFLKPEDGVLLKGANGLQMWTLLDAFNNS